MRAMKEIIEEAESLPVEERIIVIDSLLQSINPMLADVEAEWIKVAKSRLAELRSGRVKAVPGSEVFAKIPQSLREMTFLFHPEADEEFRAAIEYYEDREPGLGYDFSVEVFTAIENAVAHPHAWPLVEEDIHRCLVNRFPYCVLYSIEEAGVFILAAMHLRRHPDYWKDRR